MPECPDCGQILRKTGTCRRCYDRLKARRRHAANGTAVGKPQALCVDCAVPIVQVSGPGRRRLRCPNCGPNKRRQDTGRKCLQCAGPILGRPGAKFCSRACFRATQKVSSHRNHDHRVKAAPGLTAYELSRLLRQWRAAGRVCTYCGGPCDAVDHVRPLTRGGSSELDNLTPACTPCNSKKGTKLLTEWLAEPPKIKPAVLVKVVRPPAVPRKQAVQRVACTECSAPFDAPTAQRKYCPPCGKFINMLRSYQAAAEWLRP